VFPRCVIHLPRGGPVHVPTEDGAGCSDGHPLRNAFIRGIDPRASHRRLSNPGGLEPELFWRNGQLRARGPIAKLCFVVGRRALFFGSCTGGKAMSTPTSVRVSCGVRLSPPELEKLDRIAQQLGRSRANVLRRLLTLAEIVGPDVRLADVGQSAVVTVSDD
jgi:hypothetical protein